MRRVSNLERRSIVSCPREKWIWLTEAEHDYARPLSRAALTAIMSAYATPSIAI